MEKPKENIKVAATHYSWRKTFRNCFILVIALALGYGNYKYVSAIFENITHFSHLSEKEREISYFSERAFYYSYYKTMVEERPLIAGISNIMYDRLVEYPKVVNAFNRFNVYPEVMLGALYRYLEPWLNTSNFRECHVVHRGEDRCLVKSCVGIGEPILFYLEGLWWLAGLMLAAVFMHGVVLSETILGGVMSAAQFMANHMACTRVNSAPNLRENFATPLLFAQMWLLAVQLRNRERRTAFHLQVSIFILNCVCLLFWQFTQFIFLTQIAIFFVMEQLRIIELKTLCVILHSHFCGLHMAVLLLQGNDMLKSSLYTSFFLVVSAYCLFFSSFRVKVQNRTDLLVESWLVLLRISIVICSSVYLKKVISDFLDVDADSHIWDFLYSKFTNYYTFHTLLYTCCPPFSYLSLDEILEMLVTLLIPLAFLVCVNVTWYWVDSSLREVGKGKKAVLVDESGSDTEDSGIENNTEAVGKRDADLDALDDAKTEDKDGLVSFVMHLDVDPAVFYNISQMVVFGVLAALMMRLSILFVPQMCVVSSLLVNAKYYVKSNSYLVPVFWTACFTWVVWCAASSTMHQFTFWNEVRGRSEEELIQWVLSNTSASAVFAGTMQTTSMLLLTTRRPIVVHPQYEHKEARDRAYAVYKMYGRFTPEELYQDLTRLKVSYLIVDKIYCDNNWEKPRTDESFRCTALWIWDAVLPALKPRPQLCIRLLTEPVDNLYRVYENKEYAVYRVHDLSVRYMPRSFDS